MPIVILPQNNGRFRKEDFKQMISEKKVAYSPFEEKLLSEFLQCKYSKQQFDPGNRRMLAEANRQLFDFSIKVDYTAPSARQQTLPDGRTLSFADARLERLWPYLEKLALGAKNQVSEGVKGIYELKMMCLQALGKTVELLGFETRGQTRFPETSLAEKVYDVAWLERARTTLNSHFGAAYPIFLVGSFLQNEKVPSDLDMRVVIPKLTAEGYSLHIGFAAELREKEARPTTFMLIPQEQANAIVISENNNTFATGNSILLNSACAFSCLDEKDRTPLRVVEAMSKLVGLREILHELDAHYDFLGKNGNAKPLRARLNDSYYAAQILERCFGKLEYGGQPIKFSEAELIGRTKEQIVDNLADASLAMQEVIHAYYTKGAFSLGD